MYSGIIPIIKQAAVEAVDASQPVNITFGTVTSASPLKIQISPKLTLGAGNLILTQSVSKYSVKLTFSGETNSAESHTHTYNVNKTVTIDNGLKKGDKVILARVQGGQSYLVIDKVVG